MDKVYSLGVEIIESSQELFPDWGNAVRIINNLADPHYTTTHLFPLIAVFDSVFAAEFLLVTAVGGWLNAVLKWILMEHRPFWWVRETHIYSATTLPHLRATPQTCETGPGCPSGHLTSAAMVTALLFMWALGQDCKIRWWKQVYIGISFIALVAVSFARIYVLAHFPHQCLLGIIFGFLTAHFVSSFLVRPFLAMDSTIPHYMARLRLRVCQHILLAIGLVLTAVALYWGQKWLGVDPQWSVKLAFKWCPSPDYLHYNTTPLYAFVETTGSALGWAICVTPSVKSYRFNTKQRYIILAVLAAFVFQEMFRQWQLSISKDSAAYYYLMNFAAYALRPLFFIRIVPLIATFRHFRKARMESSTNKLARQNSNATERKTSKQKMN